MQSVICMQAVLLMKYQHHWSSKYKHNLHVQIRLVATPVSHCVACQLWNNTALYMRDYGSVPSQLSVVWSAGIHVLHINCCQVFRGQPFQ